MCGPIGALCEGGRSMSAGAIVAVVFGGVLTLAGIVWVFLVAANVIDKAKAVDAQRSAKESVNWPEVVKEFLAWLQRNVSKKLLPGFAMMVIGTAIVIAALAFSVNSGGEDKTGPSPSPSVTAT